MPDFKAHALSTFHYIPKKRSQPGTQAPQSFWPHLSHHPDWPLAQQASRRYHSLSYPLQSKVSTICKVDNYAVLDPLSFPSSPMCNSGDRGEHSGQLWLPSQGSRGSGSGGSSRDPGQDLPCWKRVSVTEVTSRKRASIGGKWAGSWAKMWTSYNKAENAGQLRPCITRIGQHPWNAGEDLWQGNQQPTPPTYPILVREISN